MIKYSESELKLILSHYLFKNCGLQLFTQRLKKYLGRDYTETEILYVESIFSVVDPANNKDKTNIDKQYVDVWNKYSSPGSRKDLRLFYQQFNNGLFQFYKGRRDDLTFLTESTPEYITSIDKPIEVPDFDIIEGAKIYRRNKNVVINALKAANYLCEGHCKNILFTKRNTNQFYTEAHHLIPLHFQENFNHSLDVEANVVSLCPMCHRLLHYGQENFNLLESLFSQRVDRLKKCGIDITFEELLSFYNSQI